MFFFFILDHILLIFFLGLFVKKNLAFNFILQSKFFFLNLTLIFLICFSFVKAIFQFNLTLQLKNCVHPLIIIFFIFTLIILDPFMGLIFFSDFIFRHLICWWFSFVRSYCSALVFFLILVLWLSSIFFLWIYLGVIT